MTRQEAPDQGNKRTLRRDVLAARATLTADDLTETADALTRHVLRMPEVREAAGVAAYASVGTEPGTGPLLEALHARGVRVLLPVLMDDNDLDWAVHEGAESLVPAGRGLREPSGPRLGPRAVTDVDVVLLPGLAVDARGLRLGRGAGCYDRALSRASAAPRPPFTAVLLHEGEVVDHVPGEAHDRSVDAVVTPAGVRYFRHER
ncbi:5-formyltetrahydrofolate cyclo-ligase [Streptomyces cacaoi]|uniref:5-formyltetrahydrofolate cyclo-ligase n=1 Tax=Streptomyces cacaoi TaxID=1898 RepID=UPI003747868F